MSKTTTMPDRATAYFASLTPEQTQWNARAHAIRFAASEVARVREMQAGPLTELSGMPNLLRAAGLPGTGSHANRELNKLEAATRPELPPLDDVLRERGLKHVGFVEKGGVVTDVNHKPVKVGSPGLCEHANESPRVCRCAVWCYCKRNACKPVGKPALSALARTAKRKGSR